MSKVLTKEIATRMLSHAVLDVGFFCAPFTRLDDDAAELLAEFDGDLDIELAGIEHLSARAAKALAKFKGRLNLYGLISLTEACALALAEHKGEELKLFSVKSLSEKSVIALAKHRAVFINPETITPKAARALVTNGQEIYFDALPRLTPELASELSHTKKTLSLKGLMSADHLATVLKNRPAGHWTYLNSLEIVPDELAQAIAQTKGWVHFSNSVQISPPAARWLVDCERGEVYRSFRSIREAAKKAKRKAVPKRVKPGCPAEAFGWIAGGVMAVKASAPEVKKAVEAVMIFKEQPEILEIFELLEQVDSGSWTLALCGLFNEPAMELSRILKTRAVYLAYDDTSGLTYYEIYDQGNSVERFESCEVYPGEEEETGDASPSGTNKSKSNVLCKLSVNRGERKVTFESQLTNTTKKALINDRPFIHQRFKELGICLPAKLV